MAESREAERLILIAHLTALLSTASLAADTLSVPGDSSTIQGALDAAAPGDVVEVATGVYFEKIVFPASGLAGSPIVLRAGAGQSPVLDGTGVAGDHMVLIDSKDHVQIVGFEIRNHLGVSDGSGIRVEGSGNGIEIRDNVIHDVRGTDAMGITVYGTESVPIQNLVIDHNEIYDCDPAQSEALTLNGNVTDFEVTRNLVRDVNNIAIDMIGGETDIQPDPSLVARNGVVRGNTVLRANANYDGGYAGGIYVDGGRDIVIENNRISLSDLGIEIGAENGGTVTSGIVVRNNAIDRNERAGLVFGGFEAAAGRANDNAFTGNTLYQNNTVGDSGVGTYFTGGGIGEVWIQFAGNNVIENNLIYAGDENIFVASFDPGSSNDNRFDYNLYHSDAGVASGEFSLNGQFYTGLASWVAGGGGDAHAVAADPLLSDPPDDLRLEPGSPAIDAGNPTFVPDAGETDLDGEPRLAGGRVDIGADEHGSPPLFADGFESGNVSAWSVASP